MDAPSEKERALAAVLSPTPIETKLEALDALDRLALNPSGWFTEQTLDKLFEARKLIIQSRWGLAYVPLEEARGAMEAFIRVLRDKGEAEALRHAQAYLELCARVLSWLDRRPAD